MRRVVFNQKGGVGKTSLVANLAAVSAASGLRTLVVDCDPQANATEYLLGRPVRDPAETLHGLYERTLGFSLFGEEPATRFVHRSPDPNLDVLPSHPELAELQGRLESRYKIYKLREILGQIGRYDAVYIDTPPALNFFSLAALIAADRCLIPFDCDAFSRRALDQLLRRVREIVEDHNEHLEVEGIVITQFQARARLPLELVDQLRTSGVRVLEPFIGQSVKMRESRAARRPLVAMAGGHRLTGQFRALWGSLDHGGATIVGRPLRSPATAPAARSPLKSPRNSNP